MHRLKDFKAIYDYQGDATCAADGMCQEKCPVKINTGELIKHIRSEELKEWKRASSGAMVRHPKTLNPSDLPLCHPRCHGTVAAGVRAGTDSLQVPERLCRPKHVHDQWCDRQLLHSQ